MRAVTPASQNAFLPGMRFTQRAFRYHVHGPAAEWLAVLTIAPFLLLAAVWNGFPLIFYDTGAYLFEGLGRHFLVERSPVYSLFLDIAGARVSLWIIVAIQAAVTAIVVVETTRCVAPRCSVAGLLLLSATLIAATGLPWYVGEVEPDCFAPVTVLSLYLLAFHSWELGAWRCAMLICIAGFAAAAHMSHLLLSAGLWLLLAAFFLAKTSLRALSAWRAPDIVRPLIAIAFAVVLVLSGNYVLTRQVFVTRAGPAFLFARLLQDGVVMRLLEETCPRSGYRLCAYKDRLPPTANAWLWAPYSPYLKLGGPMGTQTESERIVRDCLVRYPYTTIEKTLADAGRQFLMFRTGDQVEPQQWVLAQQFSAYLSGQLSAYLQARQQEGELAFPLINLLHVPVAIASLLVLFFLIATSARAGDPKVAVFLGFVGSALLANAFICGALSNPHDRYQSRLIWLAALAVMLVAAARRHERSDKVPASDSPCDRGSNPAVM